MFTLSFWKDAFERAIKTAAQSAAALIGIGATLQDVNWLLVGSASIVGFILSILTSIGSSLVGDNDSASLVK